MKRLQIIIISLATTLISFSQSFEQANELYQIGEYKQAAVAYQSLLDSIGGNAQLFYNLGNAQFKSGELAQSILCYERALRLQPNYKDAKYNLQFAQSRIVDNIENKDQFFIGQWLAALRNQLSEQTWAVISISLFLLMLIGLFTFFFSRLPIWRKIGFNIAWIALLLSIISFGFSFSIHKRDTERSEAIITQGIVTAKSSPDRSGTDLFSLHEGTKVRCRSTLGEWVEVTVGDNRGWIPANTLERI